MRIIQGSEIVLSR